MSANLTLVVLTAAMYSVGVYLILERSLTRVVLGVLVLGNATNLLLLTAGGAAGGAPIVGLFAPEDMSDPLAQAMILTAIVITLGLAAFLLALIHRNWQLSQERGADEPDVVDELVDDEEDVRIARLAADAGIGDDFEEFEQFEDDDPDNDDPDDDRDRDQSTRPPGAAP